MTFSNKDHAPLSGRVDGATTDYPYGSYRDETSQGADDGTPYIDDISKDLDGFKQAVLVLGGKDPNNPGGDLTGVPDTATASDILDSLLNQFDGGFDFKVTGATPTDLSNASMSAGGMHSESSKDGSGSRFRIDISNGVITYTRSAPSTYINRHIWIDVPNNQAGAPIQDVGENSIQFVNNVTVAGIPSTATVKQVIVSVPSVPVNVPVTFEPGDDGGDLQIKNMIGEKPVSNPTIPAGTDIILTIMLDPTT
jgi:hypothetical protein